MMQLTKLLKNERLMRALTGLNSKEFTILLPDFEKQWLQSKQSRYERNTERKRKPGGGRKGFTVTIPEKLFYILFYYKCYPTYDLMSLFYDCNRSNACRRQQQLSIILEITLGKKQVLPKRQMRNIEEFFRAFPEAREVFIDGTERPIQRSKDNQKQKDNYSGKKKRHTRKNLIIADKHKRVGFLGKTVPGKSHDFTMLKEQASPDNMPPRIKKHLDMGFRGIQNQFPNQCISMPKRKPRTRELSNFAKDQNKKKSSIRVLVENALAGVKRLRIVSDVFRNKKQDFDDTVMLISCGLWNYHLSMR